MNDFGDLLGTPYAPVSKIAPVKSVFHFFISGLTVEQRKERDAQIMREKQEKKAAAAAEKAAAGK